MLVVANDAILTNHAHLKRGLAAQDNCYLGGKIFETMLHSLRDCSLVKELWKEHWK